MEILYDICAVIHFSALGLLSLYGLHRLWLLAVWRKRRQGAPDCAPPPLPDRLPMVTVQLPLYNERFVAERLLDAVAALEWPAGKLEIQVLDDSTDDTSEILREKIGRLSAKGITISHIRRTHRSGFKAGALAEGLSRAQGEFIAIFDADFTPTPDFLHRTIPCFTHPRVGMVQARWGFCNAEHSWMTGVQALLLGPHFAIEHQVRFSRGLFFNFNGTAGVWRRTAIEDAGGWQSDTVTEDLDLSYRSQLAGWRFVYLSNYSVPSELPVTLSAFRGQQQRWAKGSIQTARKILPRLLGESLPLPIKCEALAHLLANFCWLIGAVVFLTLYPAVVSRAGIGPWQMLRLDAPLFLAASAAILFYFFVFLRSEGQTFSLHRLLLLPILSIGLAPSIAFSVFRGIWSNGGAFERTPKFGIVGRSALPFQAFLYRRGNLPYLLLNSILFSYSLLPVVYAWQQGTWYSLPFFALFPSGFLYVLIMEIQESRAIPGRFFPAPAPYHVVEKRHKDCRMHGTRSAVPEAFHTDRRWDGTRAPQRKALRSSFSTTRHTQFTSRRNNPHAQ